MASVTTSKRIDPAQLAAVIEAPVSTIGGDPISTRRKDVIAEVDQAVLEAAVEAYTYQPSQLDLDRQRKEELAAKATLTPQEILEAVQLYLRGVR